MSYQERFKSITFAILTLTLWIGFLQTVNVAASAEPIRADLPQPDAPEGAITLNATELDHEPNTLIVRFAPTAARQLQSSRGQSALPSGVRQVNAQFGLTALQPLFAAEQLPASRNARHQLDHIYKLTLDASADLDAAIEAFEALPDVIYAEKNGRVELQMTPNDEYFTSNELWGLTTIGAPTAWNSSTGAGVVVAVIDSGVDVAHPDLAANIWVNSAEIANNGIDDDGNGFIDDVNGWDFTEDDNTPNDGNGHGTHVAGTIAAVGNNNNGVVGVAYNAQILPIRGLNTNGSGYNDDLEQALLYAANSGADIINNSWGGFGRSQAYDDVVNYAHDQGALVISAAGNSGGVDACLFRPTNVENSMTVAATDNSDALATYSNVGVKVDVAAPGGASGSLSDLNSADQILSTLSAGSRIEALGYPIVTGSDGAAYVAIAGTSMATPHVSGVAALIMSANPTWTNEQVKQAIRVSADDILDSGFDTQSGYGRINAATALALSSAPAVASITAPYNCEEVTWSVDIVGSADANYTVAVGAGDNPTSFTTISTGSGAVTNDVLATWDTTSVPDGVYTIRVTANGGGVVSEDRNVVTVNNVIITDPTPYQLIDGKSGVYTVHGLAAESIYTGGADLQHYTLSYAPDGGSFTPFYTSTAPLQSYGILGTWDVSTVPDGEGTLRLTATYDTHTSSHDQPVIIDQLLQSGWPVNADTGIATFKSPQVVDLDGDGSNEVVLGTAVFQADGSVRPGWDNNPGYGRDNPAIVDIDADGRMEVITLEWTCHYASSSCSSHPNYGAPVLYAYNADRNNDADGMFDWQYVVENDATSNTHNTGHPSSISVGDVDGDNQDEVVFTIWFNYNNPNHETTLFILDAATGALELKQAFLGTMISSVLLADLDGDSDREIVFASYDGSGRGGPVRAVHGDGTALTGWPQESDSYGTGYFDLVSADVDQDGDLEVLAGNHLWHHDGTFVDGWPTTSIARSTGAIVPLADGDAEFEVVAGGANSIVYKVYEHDGTTKYTRGRLGENTYVILIGGNGKQGNPIVGDLNGDGNPDIIRSHELAWTDLRPANLYATESTSANFIPNFPRRVNEPNYIVRSTSTLADLDGDGDTELLVAAGGQLYAWDLAGTYNADNNPWPMFQQNLANTGTIDIHTLTLADSPCLARNERTGTIYTTIQAAADVAQLNDVVKVAGQCDESVLLNEAHVGFTLLGGYDGTDWSTRDIQNNKTIVGSGPQRYAFRLHRAANFTISGFWMTGGISNGVELVGASNNVIERNYIHDIVNTGPTFYSAGITIDSINLHPANNNVIRNNVIWNINGGTSHGIKVMRFHPSYSITGLTIENNTINVTTDDGIQFGQPSSGGQVFQAVLQNNVITNIGDDAIELFTAVSPTVDYNCTFGAGQTGAGPNDVVANPLYVDAANGDLRLQETSPCIDAGTTTSAAIDIAGTPRPQNGAFDMGAYEYTTPDPALLALYMLAMDNRTDSEASLTPSYEQTVQGIVDASVNEPNKTAIVLADLDQASDTRVLLIANGVVTPVIGLPNASGTLDTALHEYDMTDGAQLGGFLKWALDTHAQNGVKTTLSYIGHGTFNTPDTDLSNVFPAAPTRNTQSGLFPLPARGHFIHDYTDEHPQRGIISPHALQQMLDIGTNSGSRSLDVFDVTHCFAASAEELYELSNPAGTPYADMLVGSPQYAYFAPEMLGEALRAVDPAADAATMATALMTAYDTTLASYDNADADSDVDHPRALHVYDSTKLPLIKSSMDTLADQLINAFNSQPTLTKDKLNNAYDNTPLHYDTTFCAGDWQMAAPDALVDGRQFMQTIAGSFSTLSGVGISALAVDGAIEDAVVASAVHSGIPWFADPATPMWDMSNSSISLYADLAGSADGNERALAWQSRFYTDTVSIENPHPLMFVQDGTTGVTWADVFTRYWQIKAQDEGLTIVTEACLPDFPDLPDSGELAALDLTLPLTGTLRVNAPMLIEGSIATQYIAVNPLVQFTVTDASNTVVFSDSVGAGYLVSGTHSIAASKPFTPTASGDYTIMMTVDADDRFDESDESNNSVSRTETAYTLPNLTLDVSVHNDLQWVSTHDVSLALNPSMPLDWLVVHVYQHSDNPVVQVPTLIDEIVIEDPTTPVQAVTLPTGLEAGHVTLHVWGLAGASLSNPHQVVHFNYAPHTAPLVATGDSDYYIFNADAGDTVQIDCSLASGGASMTIWQPNNLWSAEQVTCNDSIAYTDALAGEYLVKVEATAANTNYIIIGTRNGVIGRNATHASAAEKVMIARPDVVAPSVQLDMTEAHSADCSGNIISGYIPSAVLDSCAPSTFNLFLPMTTRGN